MSVLLFEDVSLNLGGKAIVTDLTLRIADQDRIGLVGPNGSGKTTLLRMAVGTQGPDSGEVHRGKGARIGYLPQDIALQGGKKLLDFVTESVPGKSDLTLAVAEAETQLAAQSQLAATGESAQEELLELAGKVADLHEALARFEQQYSTHEAQRILVGLRFRQEDLDRDLGEFSGGWKMRALLASLLFQRPDLLLLDEPTNHLDMPSVSWLSSFLYRYDRAFILISHDREFLNEQIQKVVSFEVEGIRQYKGDYETYLEQRKQEEELIEARARNLDKEREHMEAFVRRFRAKASKASQVQSRVKALEKMERIELPAHRQAMRFRFKDIDKSGKDVLIAEHITKHYGEKRVLEDIGLRLGRGDRVAILGENGAGKTTLLRVLAGELDSDEGTRSYGTRVKLGYYAQHHVDVLDGTRTVFEEVKSAAMEGSPKDIYAALGAMLFRDQEVDKKVGVLSGGERARVALARLLVDPGNLLMMDEPTNHLDLDSSERLAEALETFDGTLLFVSHNRGFVRRLATKIWFVANGKLEVYPGTLDEYLASERDANHQGRTAKEGKPRKADKKGEKMQRKKAAALRQKLSPLRNAVKRHEEQIANLEREHASILEALSDPSIGDRPEDQRQLSAKFDTLSKAIERTTGEWMAAQEKLDAAQSSGR
ncbi:MAG: ABC-F family ATP-binding cassette domain-containing protein [Myxococcota bacterium]